MTKQADSSGEAEDGDHIRAVGGTHAGRSGIVEDRKTSKTGHVTITVRQDDGERFKTLTRNVVVQPRQAPYLSGKQRAQP
jgi:ribosomal protein S4E